MSWVIHKAVIDFREKKTELELPIGSEVISCDFQGEQCVIWYKFLSVDFDFRNKRTFIAVRTGEEFGFGKITRFIGTAHDKNPMPFVLHIYEILNP